MRYGDRDINLAEFIELRYQESYAKYGRDSWQWQDEGLVYAIMDYESSCEFSEEDKQTIESYGFEVENFITD